MSTKIATANIVATKMIMKVTAFNVIAVASMDDAREAHAKMRSAHMAATGQPIGKATLTVGDDTYTISNNSNIWDASGNLYHGVRFDGSKVVAGAEA